MHWCLVTVCSTWYVHTPRTLVGAVSRCQQETPPARQEQECGDRCICAVHCQSLKVDDARPQHRERCCWNRSAAVSRCWWRYRAVSQHPPLPRLPVGRQPQCYLVDNWELPVAVDASCCTVIRVAEQHPGLHPRKFLTQWCHLATGISVTSQLVEWEHLHNSPS